MTSLLYPKLRLDLLPAMFGYIHNASYLGGLIGLMVALLHLRRQRNKVAPVRCQLS